MLIGYPSAETEGLLAVSRLVLAVTFGVAGFAKARDPEGSSEAMRELAVPRRLVPPLSVCLPSMELGLAFLLLWADTAVIGSAVALALLLSFIALTASNLARRRVPNCGCFGKDHATPAGLPGMCRNVFLAALAGLVLWYSAADPGPDVLTWVNALSLPRRLVLLAGLAVVGIAWARPEIVRRLIPLPRQGVPREAQTGAVRLTNATPSWPNRRGPAFVRSARGIELTIGMATYRDFDGVYFTLQALRLYQDLSNTELLVVDNYGCGDTKAFVQEWAKGRYILARDVVGTAAPRELVFQEAVGKAVLCCDSHVLFHPGVIGRLRQYYRDHPDCADLLQGPLVFDDGCFIATHMEPLWREQMWGTWATDPRGLDPDGEPFEIPMQGLGAFSSRKEAWLGFNPDFRGFGGEEGYIHEKFRQAGRRNLCLPWFRWMHRFGRPAGVPFPLRVEDKFRNYLLGHAELGLDTRPVVEHFSRYLQEEQVRAVLQDVLGQKPETAMEASGLR
jgi:uncharacterized membrane protein YphA (DoxX/SURF4 family)